MKCRFCFAAFQDVGRDVLPKGHLLLEGTIAWLQPGQGRFELNGIDLTPDLAEPLQIQRSWLDYLHLICMHAAHAGTFNWQTYQLRKSRTFSERC